MQKCVWRFPNSNGSVIKGIADAGIETFAGDERAALARETIQNSLDALRDDEDVVKMVFKSHVIDPKLIPGYDDYLTFTNNAIQYWKPLEGDKTKNQLYKAKERLLSSYIQVLQISDYNTIGLSKPYKFGNSGWNALTKIDGGATKSGDTGGAFGIGKNAPFCNSLLRMVFYRTLNMEGETAAQGVSRYVSFPEDLNNAEDTLTTGIGHFGNPKGNMPVPNLKPLNQLEPRNEPGTDVFIYGFTGSDVWSNDIIVETLESFLVSIYKGKLDLIVKNEHLNQATLNSMINKYIKKSRGQTYYYYKVLANQNTKVFTKDFHDMGTLKLSVYTSDNEKLNRKVLVTRTSGMKIFDMSSISKTVNFTGILELQGSTLNQYFKNMENPRHDKWEPDRYGKDKGQAKAYIDELKNWVRECVASFNETIDTDEVTVEGLGGVLKLNSNDNALELSLGKVSQDTSKKDGKRAKGRIFLGTPLQPGTVTKKPGTIDDEDGKHPAVRLPKGKVKKRSKRTKHRGNEDPNGKDIVLIDDNNGSTPKPGSDKSDVDAVLLSYVKVIKIGNRRYKAVLQSPKPVSVGHLEITAVGENGRATPLKISNAKGGIGFNFLRGDGSFMDCGGNTKLIFEFSLPDNENYAMEVNLYEHS